MSIQAVQILSPVGRLVQGHPMKMSNKGYEGKPLTDKLGNLREECFFAVAIPKTDPAIGQIWQQLQQVAQSGFPGGQSQWPTFSWKVKDGDQPPHNTKEGFAGHYVFSFKSGYQPKVYTRGGEQQIVDDKQIKCGDYVRVYFNINPNGDLKKPGLFMNPSIVELVGYGEEIVSGPSGDVFAQNPVGNLPPGASATPTAGPGFAPPGMPAAAGPGFAPPGMPAAAGPGFAPPGTTPTAGPGFAPPGMPAAAGPGMPPGVAPAPDFLNPPPGASAPPVPAPRQMTAKAGGVSYEQYRAGGWTDEQLVQHGYMLA